MNGKTVTTLPSVLSLPEKIEEMLRSEDVEMVKLGAVWLEQNTPQRTWQDYMSIAPRQFWSFVETKKGVPQITIMHIPDFDGRWPSYTYINMGNQTNTYTYTIQTGSGGYNMLQEALDNHFKNQQI